MVFEATPQSSPSSSSSANYIAQADIENVFGVDNVRMWSNLNNDSDAVDTGRIAAAIAYAEEQVDDQFRNGAYTLPFATSTGGVPTTVKDWAAKLAGMWLHDSRGVEYTEKKPNLYRSMRKSVEKEMRLYAAGSRILNAVRTTSNSPRAPIAV